MNSVVAAINGGVARLFEVLWIPLSALPISMQLAIVSIVSGVVMVLLFGRISNQDAIRRVRNDISAHMLESILFRYDTRQSLRAQAALFWAGVRYLTRSLWPVLVMAVPFTIIMAHLNTRLGYRPLSPGEEGVLSVTVPDGVDVREVQLLAGDVHSGGVSAVNITGPMRIPRDREIVWRIQSAPEAQSGASPVANKEVTSSAPIFKVVAASHPERAIVDVPVIVRSANAEVTDSSAGRPGVALGTSLSGSDWGSMLLFPNGGISQSISAATNLSSQGGNSATVDGVSFVYPERDYSLFGISFSWISIFLILSLLSGFAGSKIFGVAV